MACLEGGFVSRCVTLPGALSSLGLVVTAESSRHSSSEVPHSGQLVCSEPFFHAGDWTLIPFPGR